jgi:AcrR family transcriptional regulator
MSKRNKKLESIVGIGRELFWKFGMKRVTVEEICQESNVSKMTFYKYFRNKEELAIYILREIFDIAMAEYREVFDSNASFEIKIRSVINMKLRITQNLSKEFLKDIYQGEFADLNAYIKKISEDNLRMIYTDFTEAQWKGEIRADIKIDFIIYFLNKAVEMVSDDALINMYDSVSEMIAQFTDFFLYGLVKSK